MTITQKIAAAGVVGCGGAGFPTKAKLQGKIEHLIVNGAECEPMLRTDRYIMTHRADALVSTLMELMEALNIPKCTIALKKTYTEEITALQASISQLGARVELCRMDNFYPAGDEQAVVYEVTKRVVPPGGIPIAVGAVVDNVATILAVHDALKDIPLTHKYLTVAGEVNSPVVLHVPIGTSFAQCIALAGGPRYKDYFVVAGGPMMGRPITRQQAQSEVVTKTTSGILVLPADGYHATQSTISIKHMLNRAKSACIQCSACSQLCPRHMLGHPIEPHKIMRKMAMSPDIRQLLNDPVIQSAALCCECGACEVYACPMGLQPRKINSMLKKELGKAGIRYQADKERVCTVHPERELRKIPSERLAARAGVLPYYHRSTKNLVQWEPEQVRIPLKMHIGAPCNPAVRPGEWVRTGQLIAQCPEGALGADIHASISGTVVSVDNGIEIIRG